MRAVITSSGRPATVALTWAGLMEWQTIKAPIVV
jgi:hypothetical protein